MKKNFVKKPVTAADELPLKYVKKIDRVATELAQVINYLLYSGGSYVSDGKAAVLEKAADILAGLYEEHS